MEQEYTLLSRIFCKWLGWHWLNNSKKWHYAGKQHAPCRFCGMIISRKDDE